VPNQGKAHPVYHAAGLRKDPALAFTNAQPSRFARQRAPASGAFLRRLKFWAPSTAANEEETTVAMSAPVSVKEVEEARDAWIAAVKKGSVEETVGCYDPVEGKLLGTVDTPVESECRDAVARARTSESSLNPPTTVLSLSYRPRSRR